MADYKLDPLTGDLVVDGGMKLTEDQAEEAAQRVSLALGLNLGEWFADVTKGLPYIENKDEGFSESIRWMLGDKFPNTPDFIHSTLTKYLEDQEFIRSVEASSEFDSRNRIFRYTANIVGENGVEITIAPFESQL